MQGKAGFGTAIVAMVSFKSLTSSPDANTFDQD